MILDETWDCFLLDQDVWELTVFEITSLEVIEMRVWSNLREFWKIRSIFWYVSDISSCFFHFNIESSGLLTSWINFLSSLFYVEAICNC